MHLFRTGAYTLSSGIKSDFKIECEALQDKDWRTLALIYARDHFFKDVIGIPSGGMRFAEALKEFCITWNGALPILVADDVWTTGKSLEKLKTRVNGEVIGVVAFARSETPDWVTPILKGNF